MQKRNFHAALREADRVRSQQSMSPAAERRLRQRIEAVRTRKTPSFMPWATAALATAAGVALAFVSLNTPEVLTGPEQIGAFTVSDVAPVTGDAGTSYTGKLSNDIDITVENPAVMIFPLNTVGRPLGMATGTGTVELEPGASFSFTTTADVAGMGYHAYGTAKTSQSGSAGAGGQELAAGGGHAATSIPSAVRSSTGSPNEHDP